MSLSQLPAHCVSHRLLHHGATGRTDGGDPHGNQWHPDAGAGLSLPELVAAYGTEAKS